VPFRGGRVPLVKIKLRVDFPLYRIQSGRTHRAQSKYLEQHPDLPSGFFDDPEDDKVQEAQRQILLQMIEERGLAEDLEERHQQQPIVLTKDGFIVDGNRRITALREQKEEYAIAVVLPEDAQSDEIYDTELELQMARDTKSEYNWIDELLHVRYGNKVLKESIERIAKRMRKSKEELRTALEVLSFVDEYLAWAGQASQYHKVPDDMEQAFGDLVSRMKARSVDRLSANAKSGIKHACFAVIKTGRGTGKVYEAIRSIIQHMAQQPAEIVERLREHVGFQAHSAKGKSADGAKGKNDVEDPLARLADADLASTAQPYVTLSKAFEDPDAGAIVAPKLVEVVEELEEEKKEEKKQPNPVQVLEKVELQLAKIKLDARSAKLERVAELLERINGHVEKLAELVGKIKKK
jgi:hypothetical protein